MSRVCACHRLISWTAGWAQRKPARSRGWRGGHWGGRGSDLGGPAPHLCPMRMITFPVIPRGLRKLSCPRFKANAVSSVWFVFAFFLECSRHSDLGCILLGQQTPVFSLVGVVHSPEDRSGYAPALSGSSPALLLGPGRTPLSLAAAPLSVLCPPTWKANSVPTAWLFRSHVTSSEPPSLNLSRDLPCSFLALAPSVCCLVCHPRQGWGPSGGVSSLDWRPHCHPLLVPSAPFPRRVTSPVSWLLSEQPAGSQDTLLPQGKAGSPQGGVGVSVGGSGTPFSHLKTGK